MKTPSFGMNVHHEWSILNGVFMEDSLFQPFPFPETMFPTSSSYKNDRGSEATTSGRYGADTPNQVTTCLHALHHPTVCHVGTAAFSYVCWCGLMSTGFYHSAACLPGVTGTFWMDIWTRTAQLHVPPTGSTNGELCSCVFPLLFYNVVAVFQTISFYSWAISIVHRAVRSHSLQRKRRGSIDFSVSAPLIKTVINLSITMILFFSHSSQLPFNRFLPPINQHVFF